MFMTVFVHRPRHFIAKVMSSIRRQFCLLNSRQALTGAIQSVYDPFADHHEQWADNLFDEHFLVVHVAPLLLEAWEQGHCPTPARLAMKWRAQFSPANMIADMLAAEATQVAADFLAMLDAELDTVPVRSVPC